jgi:hypothetical protein
MKKKRNYYAILSKKDNFLYGAFEVSKEGKFKAQEYLKKISTSKSFFYIKKI